MLDETLKIITFLMIWIGILILAFYAFIRLYGPFEEARRARRWKEQFEAFGILHPQTPKRHVGTYIFNSFHETP